jgi:glycosyltransferase involved in cell wall biosynthesis
VKPIRLLFVLTSPVRGGVEEVVLGLLRRLDPSEFRLGVAAPATLLDGFAADLRGVSVDVEAMSVEPFLRRDAFGPLSRFLRRFRPDLVNSHLFRSTAAAAPVAAWHGVPLVETYHGREGWRRGLVRGRFLPDRLIARLVDRVIAVSEAARTFLITGKGYPEAKVTVVANGRDFSLYQPGLWRDAVRAELGLAPSTPVVGVVGRLETQKGHAYLLDAWPAVRREIPDARLLVVGDGGLRATLEHRAHELGSAESVIFAGFRSDVPRMLDAMDVMVLPSLYEGMPLTAIEGSAMARPVVATAVDGTPEVVRDGQTGHLVPPANPAELTRAMLALLRDPDGARRMGQAGRDWVLTRFDVDRHVQATADVYRSVASSAVGRGTLVVA